jgi:uncharacterized protein
MPASAPTSSTRRSIVKVIGAAILSAPGLSFVRARERKPGRTSNVLLFTKSGTYEHDVVKRAGDAPSLAEKVLGEIGERHQFDVVATKDGGVFDGDLSRYDAFCLYTEGNVAEVGVDKAPPMSARGKAALLAAVRRGKGFVGLHSASATYCSSPQDQFRPYARMLGGEFRTHGEQQEARVTIVDPGFPGMPQESFRTTEEWYSLANFQRDLHVLLRLETDGMHGPEYNRLPFPIAWARREGRGRVYYNAMGHREDVWRSERFQRMLAGALVWAMHRVDIAFAPNGAE